MRRKITINKIKMNKKIITLLAAIFLILGIGILYHIYPRCLERETSLEIPEYLKNSTVKFEQPMAYVFWNDEKEKKVFPRLYCTNASKVSKGSIISVNENQPALMETFRKDGYILQSIPLGEEFKVIGRVKISCPSFHLECINHTGTEDDYLLQNAKGEIWRIFHLDFKNLDYGSDKKPWNAGYYSSDGKRLGDVVTD